MSEKKIIAILITGKPGVGKTTIVKKLYNDLCNFGKNGKGFYTEEVRNKSSIRIGFDIVTLDGKRCELSRDFKEIGSNHATNPKVGKYFVYVNKFESLALSSLTAPTDYVLIDEIGKMELLSKTFQNQIRQMFLQSNPKEQYRLIATIPNQQKNPIEIVEQLKAIKTAKVFEIKANNRNEIYKEIFDLSCKMFL